MLRPFLHPPGARRYQAAETRRAARLMREVRSARQADTLSEVSFDDGDVPSESSLGEQGEVLCDGPVELTASVSRSRSRLGLSRRMRRDETRRER